MQNNYNEPIFPISIVAKLVGVTPKMLRTYEEQGLITPSRTPDKPKIRGRRLYSQKDVEYLKILRKLLAKGFSIENLNSIYMLLGKVQQCTTPLSKEDFITLLNDCT